MKIAEDQEFKKKLLTKIEEREFSERTGVHCSDLIYCLNKQALRKSKPLPTQEHELLLFSLGLSTQDWLTGKQGDMDGIEVDGITVTPDAQMCPDCGGIIA